MDNQHNSKARPRVVIIGGGFAGIQLAKNLRKAPVDILMIDKLNRQCA